MRYFNRQNALFWLVALTAILFGPKLPSAQAQPESLADWPAKAQAKGFAGPLPANKAVRFSNFNQVLHNKGQWVDATNDPPQFIALFEQKFFPLTTHLDLRGTVDDPVVVLHKYFKQLEPNSPAFDALADLTLDYMSKIAADAKWNPAVRENALLAIGEVKSPKTVELLIKLIRNKDLHQMFKVVAMTDLVHLAEQGVLADEAVADPVVKLMAMAAPRKIPNDGWRWIRGQAADILGAVGNAGNNVPAALLTMMADEELPLIIRGKAARALGKLKYNGNLPDAATITKTFARFGRDSLADNLPGESRRIWAVCNDFLGGLEPLTKQGTPPQAAHDIQSAMGELRRAASKPNADGGYPSEEDLKPAVAKARKVLDAAAKK